MLSGIQAIRAGLTRAMRSPLILVSLWLAGLLAAVPAGWFIAGEVQKSIGSSHYHESMTRGFDADWFEEYQASAEGLAKTFVPSLIGAGAFYDNLERWLTGRVFRIHPPMLITGLLFALVWIFLLGGIYDRYANPDRSPGPERFFGACAGYYFRFIRLTVLAAVLYYLVYRLLGLMCERIEALTRESTTESTLISYSLLAWGFIALLLTLTHMWIGFTRAVIVVEERTSVLMAALRGLGYVLFHAGRSLTLYYGILLLSALMLGLYSFVAPGAGQATPRTILIGFLVAQLFLLVRLLLRLSLIAGQVALLRANLSARQAQIPSADAAAS